MDERAPDRPQDPVRGQEANGVVGSGNIGDSVLGLKIDASSVKKFLDDRVREAVQEILQVFLEEEATSLVGAERYERTEGRTDHRNGHRIHGW